MSFFHIVIKHFTFFLLLGYIYEHWLVHWYINNLIKTKIQHIKSKSITQHAQHIDPSVEL